MYIGSNALENASQAYGLLPVQKKKQQALLETGASVQGTYDKVSISDEAFAMAAQSQAEKMAEAQKKATEQENSVAGQFSTYLKEKKGQKSSESSQDTVEGIKKQIEKLQKLLASTASSNMPDSVKQSQISTLESQINVLQQELNQMQAQASAEK